MMDDIEAWILAGGGATFDEWLDARAEARAAAANTTFGPRPLSDRRWRSVPVPDLAQLLAPPKGSMMAALGGIGGAALGIVKGAGLAGKGAVAFTKAVIGGRRSHGHA